MINQTFFAHKKTSPTRRRNIFATSLLAVSVAAVAVVAVGVAVLTHTPTAQALMMPIARPIVTPVQPTMQMGIPLPVFSSGKDVTVTENTAGDEYIAGQTASINNTVGGDLLLAGGNVTVNGTVMQNARIAGGTVIINGTIDKNVTVAGGHVEFTPNSVVKGSVVVAGGEVTLGGQVAGGTWVWGGNTVLSGNFGQDVQATGTNLTVSSQAMITGKLSARTRQTAVIDPAAKIVGGEQLQIQPMGRGWMSAGRMNSGAGNSMMTGAQTPQSSMSLAQKIGALILFVTGLKLVFGTAMGIIGGAVVLTIFPAAFREMATIIKQNPASSIGWGVIGFIVIPIVAIVLMFTIIGLPLGILLLLAYVIVLMISSWVAACALGAWMQQKFSWGWLQNAYAQLIAGIIVLQVIEIIPVIGSLTKLIALLFGFGAVLAYVKSGGMMTQTTKTAGTSYSKSSRRK